MAVAAGQDKVLVVELVEQVAVALEEMALRELLELLILVVAVEVAVKQFLHLPLKMAAQVALELSSSKQTNNEGNMTTKIYRLYGIDTAMHLLRPGAKWEITNSHFSNWEDPRPCPKWEEVLDTMEKIKAFEDSINTVWLPEQIAELTGSPEAQAKAQVAEMIAEQKAA